MPRPKKISETDLLNELLETAAQSGDAEQFAAVRKTMGDWAMMKYMPEVAETVQRLKKALEKQKEPPGVVNLFNAPVGQAMGVVDKVENTKGQ